MTVKIYGIKNCDTMKKAFQWLDEQGISYIFHDYKKQGIDADLLKKMIVKYGWSKIINTRGTTWRKLDENTKLAVNDETAFQLAHANPSIIKRPILTCGQESIIGFDPHQYEIMLKTG